MSDFLSQASPFSVKLLEGDAAGSVVNLEGRALPSAIGGRGSIAFESEQRIKTTYYAGNPVATQQLMGPIEKNTVVSGIWKDMYLGNGVAGRLRDTFDLIQRSGVAVEVTWGAGFLPDGTQVSKPLVRRGLLKRFKHTYERPQDIIWELEFEWRGRDEVSQSPLQGAGQGGDDFADLSEGLGASQAAIDAFRTDPLTQVIGFSNRIQAAFDSADTTLGQSIATVDSASAVLAISANLPNEILERVRGTTTHLLDSLQNFEDTILSLPLLALEVQDNALATIDLISRRFDMLISVDVSREKASQVDATLAARQLPDVIAEVRPTPGTDFRELARQFYGDPDLWWVIAQFNGLPGSSRIPDLPDGPTDAPPRAIRIPRRTEGAQGSLRQVC